MVSGSLSVKVLKIEGVKKHPHHKEEGHHYAVRLTVLGHEQRTKFKGHEDAIDQTIHFDVTDVKNDLEIAVDVLHEGKQEPLESAKMSLADFTGSKGPLNKMVKFKHGVKVFFEGTWVEHKKMVAAPVANVHRALTVQETHRPWYMRVSYYYDTTKNVYNYTTSFRLVSAVARFGESTTNKVLQKITGKDLATIDQNMLAPTLSTLDNKVDESLAAVVVRLMQGQNYVLQKKNSVVETATHVAHKSSEQISGVVGSTLTTVTNATNYTTTQIKSVSTSALDTAYSVKDYTTSQVVKASSSAYGTVKGATVYVAGYVPYLGAKIQA